MGCGFQAETAARASDERLRSTLDRLMAVGLDGKPAKAARARALAARVRA